MSIRTSVCGILNVCHRLFLIHGTFLGTRYGYFTCFKAMKAVGCLAIWKPRWGGVILIVTPDYFTTNAIHLP